jgi:hypothetical protein
MINLAKTLVLSFILSSCCTTPMSVPECNHDDYFNFRILSVNGEDLFGGLNPKYRIEQLKLYTINDNNKRFEAELIDGGESLTALISHNFNEGIIEIDNVRKDTIYFSLRIKEDKCCGTEAKIDKVILNNMEIKYEYFEVVEIQIID